MTSTSTVYASDDKELVGIWFTVEGTYFVTIVGTPLFYLKRRAVSLHPSGLICSPLIKRYGNLQMNFHSLLENAGL